MTTIRGDNNGGGQQLNRTTIRGDNNWRAQYWKGPKRETTKSEDSNRRQQLDRTTMGGMIGRKLLGGDNNGSGQQPDWTTISGDKNGRAQLWKGPRQVNGMIGRRLIGGSYDGER